MTANRADIQPTARLPREPPFVQTFAGDGNWADSVLSAFKTSVRRICPSSTGPIVEASDHSRFFGSGWDDVSDTVYFEAMVRAL